MKSGVPLHESGTHAQGLKHGLAAGADAAPPSPDWTIPQGWDHYTPADHAIWEALFTRQRAKDLGCLPLLARVYWYTVEFGLVQQSDGLRIYGAGIVSSASETLFALEDDSPHRIAFDLPRVMQTGYRIDDFQETYFVLQDLRQLLHLADTDFEPLYRRLQALPVLTPSSHRVAGDHVLHAGTGRYHHPRK